MPSAAKVNWAKFRVATVSLVAIVILCVLGYLLTGGNLLQPKVNLYVYIPDATGLAKGSPVSLNGVDVGKVSRVGLSGSKQPNRIVRVSMEVQEIHLPDISVDSTAEIGTENLIGDRFVDITGGRDPRHIAAGGEIQFKPPRDLMKALDLTQFAQQLRQVDAQVREVEEGRNQLGRFIVTEDMYNEVLTGVAKIQDALRAAASTTGQLGAALYTDELYRKIELPLLDLDRTLAQLQSGQGGGGRLLRDPAEYVELLNSVNGVRQSIVAIQSGTFFQSDAMYNDLTKSLTSVIARVDEIQSSAMFASSETYDNLTGMAREFAATVHDFRENPKKYLRLKVF